MASAPQSPGQWGQIRNQVWLRPFLVDFYCAEAKMAVEVDGDTHAYQFEYDARRTAWLNNEGFQVVRFTNHEVMTNLEGVADTIRTALALTLPPLSAAGPSLSPEGERGS